MSDIDTGVVVSLKVLDPDGRLEKRTNKRRLDLSVLCQKQTLKCAAHGPRTTVLLVQRLDDADVTHRAIAERLERLLVGGACIGGDSLLDAREFRDDDALFLPGLVSGGRRAAREIASAKRRDRRRRKLRISGKLLRIRNRAIDGDPVGFQHRRLRVGGCGST